MSNISHISKFKSSDESRVWVSSDFHLGHNRPFVWEERGFSSSEEHTNSIINNLNENIRPADKLFFMGDFCLNTPPEKFEEYLARINCQNIYMIWGNHNNPFHRIYKQEVLKKYGEDVSVYPFRYKNVIFMGDYLEAMIDGKIVVMMHYPIEIWNFMKEGSYMLCGHSHYNFPKTRATSTDGKILDVGWDGNRGPYSFGNICKIMDSKVIGKHDHHVV